jgi:hypothetical protein
LLAVEVDADAVAEVLHLAGIIGHSTLPSVPNVATTRVMT